MKRWRASTTASRPGAGCSASGPSSLVCLALVSPATAAGGVEARPVSRPGRLTRLTRFKSGTDFQCQALAFQFLCRGQPPADANFAGADLRGFDPHPGQFFAADFRGAESQRAPVWTGSTSAVPISAGALLRGGDWKLGSNFSEGPHRDTRHFSDCPARSRRPTGKPLPLPGPWHPSPVHRRQHRLSPRMPLTPRAPAVLSVSSMLCFQRFRSAQPRNFAWLSSPRPGS